MKLNRKTILAFEGAAFTVASRIEILKTLLEFDTDAFFERREICRTGVDEEGGRIHVTEKVIGGAKFADSVLHHQADGTEQII